MAEKLEIIVKPDKDLTKKEYREVIALTTQAFNRDYTPYMKIFKDPTHFLARLNGKLVSYVAIVERWIKIGASPLLKTAYIEGMATDFAHRHKGFATQVMRCAMSKMRNYEFAALSTGSKGFYTRLGWQLWKGPLFARKEKELIPMPGEQGCVMVYNLPGTPPYDITAPMSIEWREIEPW
jgi:aminoglycoside 2'-N-acetyltransferase I